MFVPEIDLPGQPVYLSVTNNLPVTTYIPLLLPPFQQKHTYTDRQTFFATKGDVKL